jgi:peptidoglycan/xylan/chitin deacetylase (PgdA/CDA1 family)
MDKYYNGKTPKTDLMKTSQKLINLFDEYNVKGTFFVLGETAEKYPELTEMITGSSHEFACHGFYHNKKYDDALEFRDDIQKFKNEILSDLDGFRFPNFDYTLKKMEVLKKENFKYDSSVVPCLKIPGWYGNQEAPIKPYHMELKNGGSIFEFPLSVLPFFRLPGGGGWFLRNFGLFWTKIVVKNLLKSTGYGVIYLHPWEISENNPTFDQISFHVFRNTGLKTYKNMEKLINYFSNCEFISLSEQFNSK